MPVALARLMWPMLAGCCLLVAAAALVAAFRDDSPGSVRLPFVWSDVASVWLACSLPGAWIAARRIDSRLGATAGHVTGLVLFSTGLLVCYAEPSAHAAGKAAGLPGTLWRAVAAFSVSCGLILASGWAIRRGPSITSVMTAQGFGPVVVAIAMLLPPSIYTASRARRQAAAALELVDQSRYGEARQSIDEVLALAPQSQRRRLADVRNDLQRVVSELERQVRKSSGAATEESSQLDQARRLAMLGRTTEALELIKPLTEHHIAAADLLAATIYETRSDWTAARQAYYRARQQLDATGEGHDHRGDLLQALRGIALCERKLGALPAAESAYVAALALAPTADTHFLLAQFYEDTQRPDLARQHVGQALRLSTRYDQAGQQLLNRLNTRHFGCWLGF